MRLSCRPDDAGYERYVELMAGNDFKFFLDGVEVKQAITADDEEGFVLVYADDGDGKPLLTPDRTEAVTERRTGAVRIDVIPRSQTQETTCASHQRPAGPRFRSS